MTRIIPNFNIRRERAKRNNPEEKMQVDNIPIGFCHCGCGAKTNLAKRTDKQKGWIAGEPLKSLRYHNKGLYRFISEGGYVKLYLPVHPWSSKSGHVFEHVFIAASVLGRAIPKKSRVHHVNEIKTDNRKENLVICEDGALHSLMHVKMRAKKACGRTDYRKCVRCKKYDHPDNMTRHDRRNGFHHKACNNLYQQSMKVLYRAGIDNQKN